MSAVVVALGVDCPPQVIDTWLREVKPFPDTRNVLPTIPLVTLKVILGVTVKFPLPSSVVPLKTDMGLIPPDTPAGTVKDPVKAPVEVAVALPRTVVELNVMEYRPAGYPAPPIVTVSPIPPVEGLIVRRGGAAVTKVTGIAVTSKPKMHVAENILKIRLNFTNTSRLYFPC